MKINSMVFAGLLAIFALCSGCSGGDAEDIQLGDEVSDNDGLKNVGAQALPPFSVDPENPGADDEVTIDIDIDGATSVAFTATGDGCGTIASTEGENPLTITGTAGTNGYCDMTATATGGVTQVYEGRFEVSATDPDIPEAGLDEGMWEDDALPDATEDGPAITAIDGPTSVAAGSTNTFTISFTGDEELEGVYLQVGDHTHGHFYVPAAGASGVASFELTVDSDYPESETQDFVVVAVDDLGRFSAQFPMLLTIEASADASLAAAFAESSSYRVSGKVTYEKFIVTAKSGRASVGKMIPVRLATVKVISARDNTTVLGQGKTKEDGAYDITFTNTGTDKRYFVQVYTTSDTLNQTVASLAGATYAFRSSGVVDGSTTSAKTGLDLEIKEADNAGAFNIWDVGVSANTYAKSSAGTAPPKVQFLWTRGEKPNGQMSSFYTTGDDGTPTIAMLSDPSDTDEYDDMVIGHEYGHFAMAQYSKDDSPGGDHTIDAYAVPTLALSEGWATFFAGATHGRSVYVDSNAAGVSLSYSFETPPAIVPRGTEGNVLAGKINEVAVNAVLWDLLDTTNETKDTLGNNSVAIWKVLTTYLKLGYSKFADRGYANRDLVDFLDGWICLGHGNTGDDDTEGLRGASVGLMELSSDFVKADLTSCQ